MARNEAFDSTAAARIRAVNHILADKNRIKAANKLGIPTRGLEMVRDAGKSGHDASSLQSHLVGEVSGSVAATAEQVKAMRVKARILAGGLRWAKTVLSEDTANVELVKSVDKVLENGIEVTVTTYDHEGKTVREREKLRTDEAWRAEAEKDAKDVLSMFGEARYKPVTDALAECGIDKVFLEGLLADAQALSGKLGEKAAKKGSAKGATQVEHKAMRKQGAAWNAIISGLELYAEHFADFAPLLAEARRQ